MTPETFLERIVEPTLVWMSGVIKPVIPVSDKARVLMMTIAGQESDWRYRRQIGIGQYHPQSVGARGYWQFESTWGGPVALNDVLLKTPLQIGVVCAYLEIPTDELTLYEACAWNDVLACALARLLLWADPAPLPEIGDKQGSWAYYLRNWRPGAPHPDKWGGYYDRSLAAMQRAKV